MKKLFAVLVFFMFVRVVGAQVRPCDSLYLWVEFSDDKILIDIPDRYMTYRSLPTSLPKHVRIREVKIFVPELPNKAALLSSLVSELQTEIVPTNKDSQLKYLGKIVLILYYGNNDIDNIPDKVLMELNRLNETPQVRNEAALVNKWIQMAKSKL